VLDRLKANNGLVMINFYSAFLSLKANATVLDVVEHVNYVKKRIGVDHVGIGSDFDGVNM
jgi:membrane dipeptidase